MYKQDEGDIDIEENEPITTARKLKANVRNRRTGKMKSAKSLKEYSNLNLKKEIDGKNKSGEERMFQE